MFLARYCFNQIATGPHTLTKGHGDRCTDNLFMFFCSKVCIALDYSASFLH